MTDELSEAKVRSFELNDHVLVEWETDKDGINEAYVSVTFGDCNVSYYVTGRDRRRIGSWIITDIHIHLGDDDSPEWVKDTDNVDIPVRKLPSLKGWLEEVRDKL